MSINKHHMKQSRHKSVHMVWFHFSKVKEQINFSIETKAVVACRGWRLTERKYKGIFWDDGCVLYQLIKL